MIRAQIQLEPAQESMVRRYAEKEGISMAEAIRRCIDQTLGSREWDDMAERYRTAASLVGSLRTKTRDSDLSERHDEYLDEVLGIWPAQSLSKSSRERSER
jgi:hypothetical protein